LRQFLRHSKPAAFMQAMMSRDDARRAAARVGMRRFARKSQAEVC